MNPPASSNPAATGRRGLWGNRDYMLLWSGQVVSAVGSQVSGLALPLLVLALTHSPAQAGIVGALEWVPYLALSLPVGVAITGALLQIIGPHATVLAVSACLLVLALWASLRDI